MWVVNKINAMRYSSASAYIAKFSSLIIFT